MSDALFELGKFKDAGKQFVLCLVVETKGSTPRKAGARMVVFEDGTIKGTIGGGSVEKQAIDQAIRVLHDRKPVKIGYQLESDLDMHCGGSMEVYFESFFPDLNLYIFGAGHVGREVGRYARDFGFAVTFIDHRGKIFQEFDSSYAHCICADYLEAANHIEYTNRDFVVITTPSHEFDELLLEKLAREKLAYLGMIGSRRKVAEARKRLLAERTLTHEQLDFVDMPIGIPFKAETPREIAISILARIIDVKNNLAL